MDRPNASSSSATGEGSSLLQLVVLIRRRWRLLAVVWSVTVAATAIYSFTTKKLYRPQASLEIRPETPLVSGGELNDPAFLASRMNYENYYRTQEQILTSPTLAEAVLKALPPAIRKEYEGKSDPLKAFSDKLDIEKVRTSFILKVGFVHESPEVAAQVVNMVVSLYLDDANRRLRDLKSGAVEVLSKETLPSMRGKIEEADKKLQDYQTASGFMDFEEHYKLLIERFRKYDATLTDLSLKKRKLRAELNALASYGAEGISGLFNPAFHTTRSLEPMSEQRSRIAAELAKQEKLLKDKHPLVMELRAELNLVDDKIREAIRGTLKALETDLLQVEQEEKGLKEDVIEVSKLMEDVGSRKFRFRQLERELADAKDLYSSYLRKHGETTATTGTTLGSVRIVDHASVPQAPYKPKVLMNLGIGFACGLLFGVGALFLMEQLDDRIASVRELEVFVGLEVLASIPKLGRGEKGESRPIVVGRESSLTDLESFRALRSEVTSRIERNGRCSVLAVLSALQSEGKSTITANLAGVLALEGKRVLIIDGDLRRPTMLGLVGTSQGKGLPDVLRGEVSPEEAVQRSRIEGVDLLGSLEGVVSAAELASSRKMEEVLQFARERYDFVLIDSAPVNLVSESAMLARKADAALLVVREFQTGRSQAMMAVKKLRGQKVNILGAVLNCAAPQLGAYGYYYAPATPKGTPSRT